MTAQRRVRAFAGGVAVAAALLLQACASSHGPQGAKTSSSGARAPEQVIQMAPIPNPEPSRSVRTPHSSTSSHHPAVEKAAEPPAAAAKPSPHPVSGVDHARAAKLRAQGLEQLDRGQINRAVETLQAAAQLDPDNPLVQHDLARALRISRAVHARR